MEICLKELKINHNVVTKESLEVVINELVATNEFKRSEVHITEGLVHILTCV